MTLGKQLKTDGGHEVPFARPGGAANCIVTVREVRSVVHRLNGE